jgi:TRAP-type C4-dicarboxylate transport system substrate-binding protein
LHVRFQGEIMRIAVIAAAFAVVASGPVAADTVSLKVAYPGAPTSTVNTLALAPWMKSIEADGGGAIELKLYAGGTIGTYHNIYDRLLNGVTDIAYGLFGEYAGQFPKSDVVTLPFETRSSYESAVALYRLYASGLTADEFGKVHVLGFGRYPYANIHARRPVNGIADLKGMKMSAFSRIASQVIENIGGTPVTMPVTEVYQSLQRGLIDATVVAWTGVETYKYYELAKFHMEAPVTSNHAFLFMNKDSYAKLTGKEKTALDKHSGEAFSKLLGKMFDDSEDAAREKVRAMEGHVIKQVPDAELSEWKARVQPVIDAWVKATPDGAKVLAAYRAEITKLKAEPRAKN